MNYTQLLLLVQFIAGASLFWSSFCRLTHISRETIPSIRFAVWLQSVAALAVVAAPYLPLFEPCLGWQAFTSPPELWVFVVISSALIQIVTAIHWQEGVPRSYTRPEYRKKRRAEDFTSTMI